MFMYICICVSVSVCVCVCVYTYVFTYIYVCMYVEPRCCGGIRAFVRCDIILDHYQNNIYNGPYINRTQSETSSLTFQWVITLFAVRRRDRVWLLTNVSMGLDSSRSPWHPPPPDSHSSWIIIFSDTFSDFSPFRAHGQWRNPWPLEGFSPQFIFAAKTLGDARSSWLLVVSFISAMAAEHIASGFWNSCGLNWVNENTFEAY